MALKNQIFTGNIAVRIVPSEEKVRAFCDLIDVAVLQ